MGLGLTLKEALTCVGRCCIRFVRLPVLEIISLPLYERVNVGI